MNTIKSVDTILLNLSEKTNTFYKMAKMENRKKEGQYMTSYNIVNNMVGYKTYDKNISILEPSFGTGQFVDVLLQNGYNNITMVEKDTSVYNLSSYKNMINADFLEYKFDKFYDLIIGNPPYFEMKCSKEMKKNYIDVIGGRPNIYSLFIKKSIDLLKDNGVLCFVIPTSLLSSKYFEKTRNYIMERCEIERIEKLNTDDFDKAEQKTMIFQIRKTDKKSSKFIVKKLNCFSPDYLFINKNLKNKKFIKDMGCNVKTGNIVWNQFRDKFTDLFTNDRINKENDTVNIPLIYPRNITTGKLILDTTNKKKFQYIKSDGSNVLKTIKAPVIAINRIIGIDSISLNPVLIEEGEYYFENHINIITGSLENLTIILNSLKKLSTTVHIKMIIGNTQLSKTELETMIPIL